MSGSDRNGRLAGETHARLAGDHRAGGAAVWRTAYRLLGNRADADECFQEAFLAALEVSRREPVRDWGALLRRLAAARALDRLRRRYRHGGDRSGGRLGCPARPVAPAFAGCRGRRAEPSRSAPRWRPCRRIRPRPSASITWRTGVTARSPGTWRSRSTPSACCCTGHGSGCASCWNRPPRSRAWRDAARIPAGVRRVSPRSRDEHERFDPTP